MYNNVGIAIITCNRVDLFKQCIMSIPKPDKMIIINDGDEISDSILPTHTDEFIQHKKNKGVGKSKNEGIKYLLQNGCNHIFLCEDDVMVVNPNVYDRYIEVAFKTGILHLNFAYHGNGNKDRKGKPIARKIIFDESNAALLSLNKNLLGAFSYYHRSVIEKIGLIDERYFNAWEHVDHTFQIIKAKMHPPFWWFADIANSTDYIKDLDIDHSKSIIRKKGFLWKLNMLRNTKKFKDKNVLAPHHIPDTAENIVDQELINIKNRFASVR